MFDSDARGAVFTTDDKNGELVKASIAIFSVDNPSRVTNTVVCMRSTTALPLASIRR